MLDALIIAPEITKGMKSLGSKALLNIKNSICILDYQIQELKKIDKQIKIFIATGFESDKIKKLSQKYNNTYTIENSRYENTNQAKCLDMFLRSYISKQLLVISNGVIFKNEALCCNNSDESKIFVIDKPKHNFTIGCNLGESVNYLFYDLPTPWSECVLLNAHAVDMIKRLTLSYNIDQLYLFEIINLVIEKYKLKFNFSIVAKKNIMKINTIKDIPKAKLFI